MLCYVVLAAIPEARALELKERSTQGHSSSGRFGGLCSLSLKVQLQTIQQRVTNT
jgi:hypothetical protein